MFNNFEVDGKINCFVAVIFVAEILFKFESSSPVPSLRLRLVSYVIESMKGIKMTLRNCEAHQSTMEREYSDLHSTMQETKLGGPQIAS